MAENFLDKVYQTTGNDAQQKLYDDWANTYEAEVGGAGYATPTRIAAALASHTPEPERALPLLDFGCGTGLGGAALAAQGFTTLDGCDLSEGMMAQARARGLYRTLFATDGSPPDADMVSGYSAVTAIGVISAGAAPAAILPAIFDGLQPGARFAFSYNGHTLDDAEYMDTLAAVLAREDATLAFSEDGPHLPGRDLISRVMVIRKG
ncbi:methyltransferase [Rhodobacterales bacterium HKCCE3408]|nr:methyltransferase [Rhodobacterales bacterium HKCCE3408]